MENKDKQFLDTLLMDLSNLDFKKFHNLLFVIAGISSPTIPLIFLFKKELIKEYDLIGVLIISIIINSIITFFLRILVLMNDTNRVNIKTNISFIKFSIYLKKQEKLKIKEEFKNKILKSNNSKKIIFYRFWINIRAMRIKIFDKRISKLDEKIKQTLEESELLSKTSFKVNSCFEMAILINMSMGLCVIFYKSLVCLGKSKVNFNIMLESLIKGYILIIIFTILSWLILKISNQIVKRLRIYKEMYEKENTNNEIKENTN
ncbi:hypothetical protein [Clostridium perfringens]|uniref:hypothetical protein n=1 Tax=Clostridium perfringens TaxID=1502 RepID=UPI000E128053|nr:hypothetical protein [Clostridium perfringens]SUY39753.1 Uncharacterised protein [Clostridium perfringens]